MELRLRFLHRVRPGTSICVWYRSFIPASWIVKTYLLSVCPIDTNNNFIHMYRAYNHLYMRIFLIFDRPMAQKDIISHYLFADSHDANSCGDIRLRICQQKAFGDSAQAHALPGGGSHICIHFLILEKRSSMSVVYVNRSWHISGIVLSAPRGRMIGWTSLAVYPDNSARSATAGFMWRTAPCPFSICLACKCHWETQV